MIKDTFFPHEATIPGAKNMQMVAIMAGNAARAKKSRQLSTAGEQRGGSQDVKNKGEGRVSRGNHLATVACASASQGPPVKLWHAAASTAGWAVVGS